MKLSGEKAVFFEPLAKNRDSTPIEWIPQDGDEDDESFFQRVTSSQHECGYTYRQQGRSRLGRRLPEGTKPPNVERVRIWEARGIPPTWATGSLSKWLEANKWTEVDFISQPTKLRGCLFRAKPAENAMCFAYESSQGDSIGISQYFHSAKTDSHPRSRKIS